MSCLLLLFYYVRLQLIKPTQPSEGSRPCVDKSGASDLRCAASEHSAVTHYHQLCLPWLNHEDLTTGCYKITTHTSTHTKLAGYNSVFFLLCGRCSLIPYVLTLLSNFLAYMFCFFKCFANDFAVIGSAISQWWDTNDIVPIYRLLFY